MVERNWAGNLTYAAATVHRPRSFEELHAIVAGTSRVRVLGTRHCFNDIADSDALVRLDGLPEDVVVDAAAGIVGLNPAVTYGRLAELLQPTRQALHNLASLPHISVGGAIATATHGSGQRLGNLATAVAALDLLRSDGEVVHLERGDPDFDGAVVGLGALGVVTRVWLDVEPEYRMAQHVFEHLSWDRCLAHLDEILGIGDSVSLFTSWTTDVEQVWVKRRTDELADEATGWLDQLHGATAATEDRHPIIGTSAEHCTPQLGRPGTWAARLPHFRMGFTPSSGDELQSELLLPRSAALAVIDTMRGFGAAMAPHLLVSEIRTVAADALWMSPQYERDTIALHCTWRPHGAAVVELIGQIETALAPWAPRPHWGKLFTIDAGTIASRVPRLGDFLDLVGRCDPRGTFRNTWFERTFA